MNVRRFCLQITKISCLIVILHSGSTTEYQHHHGVICKNDKDCALDEGLHCIRKASHCLQGNCKCLPGYLYTNRCLKIREFGETCDLDSYCQGFEGLQCIDGSCQCSIQHGYRQSVAKPGKCILDESDDKWYGDSCQQQSDCSGERLRCNAYNVCECYRGYTHSMDACVTGDPGEPCDRHQDCQYGLDTFGTIRAIGPGQEIEYGLSYNLCDLNNTRTCMCRPNTTMWRHNIHGRSFAVCVPPGYTWSQEGELCTDFTSSSVMVRPTDHICDQGLTCVKCAEDHTAQCMKITNDHFIDLLLPDYLQTTTVQSAMHTTVPIYSLLFAIVLYSIIIVL